MSLVSRVAAAAARRAAIAPAAARTLSGSVRYATEADKKNPQVKDYADRREARIKSELREFTNEVRSSQGSNASQQPQQKTGASSFSRREFSTSASNDGQETVTTSSGLQYVVKNANPSGTKPASKSDVVLVHYEGRLTNGKVFDSSYKRNQPTSFPLNQVVPGFSEGIMLMRTGEKFVFTMPPHLAYGANGIPGVIPPSSTLIFEVELLKIN